MRRTISWHLLLSFLLFSSVIIGLFGWFSMQLVNSHFSEYVSERRTEEITGYTDEIEAVFAQTGSWDEDAIAVIGRQALQDDIILKVYDSQEQLIWSPSVMEEQENRQMMSSHMSQMSEMMGGTESEYTVTTVELNEGSRTIGSLEIGTMGTYFYTEHDVAFVSDIRNNLMIVALLAFALSLFFAVWIARKLSVPVFAVSRFTGEIAKGNYTEPAPKETNIVEIDALIRSVDSLSRQLDSQQEIRNRLSSDIAHEIRTPLTTLKGNLEAMLDGIWEPSNERLKICYDEVNRISRLIGNIDKINEMESNHEKLEFSRFDLQALSKKVVTNFTAVAAKKNIILAVTGEPLMITADQDKISQVLTNLLVNAIKFTPKQGNIHIETHLEGNQAVLKVSDDGIGIDPEDQKKIFERFYMTEPSRNSRSGGQGLGLAIVKSIIKKHNGTVRVASDVGKGATFTVAIPLDQHRS